MVGQDFFGDDFVIHEVLFAHDGMPMLLVCQDDRGAFHLASALEETESGMAYLLAYLPEDLSDPVLTGHMDLRDAFLPPRASHVLRLEVIYGDVAGESEVHTSIVDTTSLTEAMLAAPGARL